MLRTIISLALSFCCTTSILSAQETQEPQNFPFGKQEALLQYLDLSKPKLNHIEAIWKEQSAEEACNALLDYYKAKTIADALMPAPIRDEETYLKRANDALLKGIYYSQAIPGTPPRSTKGHFFDWNYEGPNNDREWAWFFNRHNTLRDLYSAWEQTQDPRYPHLTSQLISDWVTANPKPERLSFSPAWRALEAARRIEGPWVETFYGFRESEAFSDDARLHMLYSIHDHGDYLMKHHAFSGNHLVTEMMALLKISIVWDEFKDAEKWRHYAAEKLTTELMAQTYPDGAHKELANHYQRVTILSFQKALDLMKISDLHEAHEQMQPRVEAMWNYFARIAKPSGEGPLNSDSDWEPNLEFVSKHNQNRKSPRKDWLWITSYGENGSRPEGLASHYFQWAGHAIMRDHWERDALWAFFDMGPYGTDHQHHDRLHLSLSLGQRDILTDAGRYTYDPGVARDYYQSAYAHNVVLLNGNAVADGSHEVTEPLPNIAETGESHDMFRATGHYPATPTQGKGRSFHTREVTFYKTKDATTSFWKVQDTLEHVGPAKWETLWHFHPDCEIEITEDGVYTTFPEGLNLALLPLSHDPEFELVKGQTTPQYRGWRSRSYGEQQPAPMVTATLRTLSPTKQVWVLIPFRAGSERPTAKLKQDGSIAITPRETP